MLNECAVPDLSPQDQARERRIRLFQERAAAAPSQRVRRHWEAAAAREIARRSEYARAEAARAALGEDGW